MIDFWLVIGLAIAGGLGAVLRLVLGKWRGRLPWGTLMANLAAGLVVGFALINDYRAWAPYWLIALLFVGFAGGLSTFSGVAAETGELIRTRNLGLAATNLAANLLLPVVACWLPVMFLVVLVK